MRNLFLLLFLAALFTACGGPEGDAVTSGEAIEDENTEATAASAVYNVDPAASMVSWEGSKLGGSHTGNITVSDGRLMVSGDDIVAGSFTMDINTLTNTDMPAEEGGDKLVGHLKSADFFDVENHPTAQFEIKQVQPAEGEGITHNLTGNLTMKGETRSVTIPAMVKMEGNTLTATTPKFVIDRNEWGMTYGNSSVAGLAQDKIINDEVGLQIKLKAMK